MSPTRISRRSRVALQRYAIRPITTYVDLTISDPVKTINSVRKQPLKIRERRKTGAFSVLNTIRKQREHVSPKYVAPKEQAPFSLRDRYVREMAIPHPKSSLLH